ncbi:hypothetical protein SETIT_3G338000v2 [Setaria italica]|uniref:Bet v I/Major latex protein domain-containing protein n=1 Tax=Setaria italica TaxID=4555 RepID=K3ZAD1_SETIT|nr:major allergen Api g 1, isoallergen 1 [Setaria italica]RCV18870.1 hypothetical protein SETIT_3G338000v2 [Setaria italica]
MVACSVTEECPVAVSAELLWKVFLAGDASIMTKACVGMIDAVEVEGDGGPGSVTTMKLNPSVGDAKVFKTRLLARDAAALVVRSEMVVEGGEVAAKLKSQVSELKVVPAGEGACVCKVTVEYERLDGTPLAPEDQAKLVHGYLGLIKKVEEYIVAHPGEFA